MEKSGKNLLGSCSEQHPTYDQDIVVSATLSGVETLKYPTFHGICFFDEIFKFFNLVSDIFS